MAKYEKKDYLITRSDNTPPKRIFTSPDMPLEKMTELVTTTPVMHATYQPVLDEAKAVHRLISLIMEGNPLEASNLLQKKPDLFFKKGQATNNDGLTIYNVSPIQVMLFLCDTDMLEKTMPWIPTDDNSNRKLLAQNAEMEGGGADLLKMDRDPLSLSFDEINTFIDRSEVDRYKQTIAVSYPLLQNKDGIIFYNNHFYYVNRDFEKRSVSVELINPIADSKQAQFALNELKASLASMENNSGRRSSDDEHLLIANTMQHTLERNGLQYERDGVRYRDTQDEFALINAYRTYIRLSKENCSDAEIDAFWIHQIGGGQRKSPMWLLQRLCENRPFIPLPNFKESPFVRDTQFFNVVNHKDESIISPPGVGLGFDYALFKAGARRPEAVGGAAGGPWGAPAAAARLDLAAIRQVIKVGMTDIAAFRQPLVIQAEESRRQNLPPG